MQSTFVGKRNHWLIKVQYVVRNSTQHSCSIFFFNKSLSAPSISSLYPTRVIFRGSVTFLAFACYNLFAVETATVEIFGRDSRVITEAEKRGSIL